MDRKNFRRYILCALSFLASANVSIAITSEDKDLAQARLLYQNAATDEAIALCVKKIAGGKNLPQWHEMYAKSLNLRRNGPATAATEIKKAMEGSPKDENIIATAGFIMSGVSPSAASAVVPKLKEAIKSHPKNGRLHGALSDCFDAMQDSHADQELLTAIQLDPLDYDVNFQAIEHYSKLANADEVNKAYDRLIKGNPKSAFAWAERGVYRRDNYKFEQSAQDLQKAVELNPKYSYAYSMLAKALKKGLKHSEAIKVYNSMLASGGPNANLLGRRANCYRQTKQLDKAIKDYDQSINIYGKGSAFVPQKANDSMSKDQRLDYNKYWLERVECREQLGQIDQGINELTAYIGGALHPDSAYDIRQRLYRRKGQYDKALSDLNYMIKKEAFVGERYTDRAEVLAKLGRVAESKEDLKHAENIETTGSP
ncbi:MAG: hypothetical protein JST89_23520 [Cyanobacteria bacterium SZAS-4]|nr:hypothetical protein [Cyanobacteria bacterium SZAS-4]